MRCLACALTAGLLFCGSSIASAQGLAEVAAKEKERRQGASDGRVYSNKDLKDSPPVNVVSSPGSPAAEAKAPAKDGKETKDAKDTGKPEVKADAKPAAEREAAKDEKAWRDRMTVLRQSLERDKLFADAMQSRINALSADFASRDDPAQRALVAIDREKALAELDRLKKAIDDDTKAIADAEDEARRAGIPPGWLR
jgi:hypothetical protein